MPEGWWLFLHDSWKVFEFNSINLWESPTGGDLEIKLEIYFVEENPATAVNQIKINQEPPAHPSAIFSLFFPESKYYFCTPSTDGQSETSRARVTQRRTFHLFFPGIKMSLVVISPRKNVQLAQHVPQHPKIIRNWL